MNKITILFFFLISIFTFVSCEKYPISALTGVPSSIDAWPTTWYLYDDEINTKGSLEPRVWDDSRFLELGDGSVVFNCKDSYKGRYSIKMEWYDNLPPYCCHYAGWGLSATDPVDVGSKSMTTSGYTRLEFEAKGNLSSGCNVKIEIPKSSVGDTDNIVISESGTNKLTAYWQTFSIPITSKTTSSWGVQKYYIAIAMRRDSDSVATNGGTIYLDNIRFTKN
ncbi:MAG: hypothetical protein WC234_03725 [Endomicrobiaceae bacterium]